MSSPRAFKTKRELINAYGSEMVRYGFTFEEGVRRGEILAQYQPDVYSGGHVIPNFGYSIENWTDDCGNPDKVEYPSR